MSKAEQIYRETGGCQCPLGHPPCSFCEALTEEEVNIFVNDKYEGLILFWKKSEKQIKTDKEKEFDFFKKTNLESDGTHVDTKSDSDKK